MNAHAKILKPDLTAMKAHIFELCHPTFAKDYPYAALEIALGHPVTDNGDVNRALTCSALDDRDLPRMAETAAIRNASLGENIYIGVALRYYGDRKIPPDRRATVENYLASRFAWVDFDKAGDDERIAVLLKEHGLTPFLVVTTGTVPHRRGQLYFLVSGIRDADHLKQVNSALQKLLGTDPAVTGAQQILRLAGGWNYPTAKEIARGYVPELVTLKKVDTAPTYSADYLIDLAGPTSDTSSGTEQRQHYDRRADDPFSVFDDYRLEADPDLIASALEFIPNDDLDWGGKRDAGNLHVRLGWKNVLLAAWRATNGDERAFAAIDRWSRKSSKYDEKETRRQWNKIFKSPPTSLGAGTVFKMALDNGWEWPRKAFVGPIAGRGFDFNYADKTADKTDSPDLIEEALDLFDATEPLRGSLGEKYLAGLGLTAPDTAHEVLRFHPNCPFGDRSLPCLVALMQDSMTNEPKGVHLTALSPDGAVIDRKIIGSIDAYTTIKLGGERNPASGELTIAISIEAALAAMMSDLKPAWSVLSADNIANFPKPNAHGIKKLTVIADDDAAAVAVAKCKARWGNLVRIATPVRRCGDE
jgi:Primase C terminal 2 (PriCT-2)